MSNRQKRMRSSRRGAAFLVLVILVLLVVVGSTQSLVRSELTSRRSESDRMRARSMLAAIEAVRQAADTSSETLRLPTGSESQEYIEVEKNENESQFIARWVKGGQVIDEMRQKIEIKAESSE